MKPAIVRPQLRKWTKVVLLAVLVLSGVLILTGVVMARPDKVSIVLQQVATNESGAIVSMFKVQSPAWNSRVKAEQFIESSNQEFQLSALALTNDAGFHLENGVLKSGDSALVTCVQRTGDRSHLVVNFTKVDTSAFYRRMTALNEHAHRHWRFGKRALIPLIFRESAGGAVDINHTLTALR